LVLRDGPKTVKALSGYGCKGFIINEGGDMAGDYLLDIILKFWHDVATLRQKTPNLGWDNFFWNSYVESPYFEQTPDLVCCADL